MTKVIHLTTVHRPFDIRIFHKECRTLAAAGYDVGLVAPHHRSESLDGVRVIGLPSTGGRARRLGLRVWQAYRAARAEAADVYHFHDPELIVIGLLLKCEGRRVVYDAHEDLPRQIMTKDWIASSLRRPLAWLSALLELIGAAAFDAVVAATPTIAARFPAGRTITVQNFPLRQEVDTGALLPYHLRPPNAVYVGGMHRLRGLYNMVEAVGSLDPTLAARLRLAGEIPEVDIRKLRLSRGWPQVDALGWRGRPELMTELGQARIGLVLLHPCPSYVDALPIKLFEYMAAGVPVLASDFPVWRSIVQESGCGLLVDPLDVNAIAQAMEWILKHPIEAAEMGERGKSAIRDRFNWDSEAAKLITYYETHFA